MTSRIASAVVGLPVLVFIVWVGSPWFTALAAVAAAVGALELCGMARRRGDSPLTPVAMGCGAALIVAAHFLSGHASLQATLAPVVAIGAAVSLAWLLSGHQTGTRASALAATAGAALYAGGLLFHAPLLRSLDQGRGWVLFLLAVTFATDTCAYFVGRAVGRHHLAPSLSPSKTWEGAVGGVLGALAASMASVYALGLDVSVVWGLALGALLGVTGQLGDLAESRMKRLAGIKDSGWLLPGHGGLLDRLDSIVFNLAVLYHSVS